jgi:chloramphenicol 3-O phosphotransferase
MAGKLIVLNGSSSAGKSSVAMEFQELASECWMLLGIDVFWCAIPQSQLDLQKVRPEYYTSDLTVNADGRELLSVTPGPLLDKAMHARYRAIKVFLDEGINAMSDDLIYTRAWLIDLLDLFEDYDVWLVGLHVSDEEGARRSWRPNFTRSCRCVRAPRHSNGSGSVYSPNPQRTRACRTSPRAYLFLSCDHQHDRRRSMSRHMV